MFYGWVVAFFAGLACTCTFAANSFGIAFFVPHLQRDLHLTHVELACLWGGGVLLSATLLPRAGKLLDVQGPWRVICATTLPLTLATLGLSVASSWWHVLILFGCVRFFGTGLVYISAVRAISYWFVKQRGRVSVALIAMFYAQMAVPLAVQPLIEQYGWRVAYRVVAVSCLIGLVSVLLFLRDAPEKYGLLPDGERREDTSSLLPASATAEVELIDLDMIDGSVEDGDEKDGGKQDIVLVVITSLPGLGKSYLFDQLASSLATGNTESARLLKGRVCICQKDQLTIQRRKSQKKPNGKVKQQDILDMVMERLNDVCTKREASPGSNGSTVLMFNMNINKNWIESLATQIQIEGYSIRGVLLLAPPRDMPFSQLQAAAVVLASEVRTGDEPEELASTLPPNKAWEVLTGSFFGNPRKAMMSQDSFLRAVQMHCKRVSFRHYPVPCLREEFAPKMIDLPAEKPPFWNKDNLEFPTKENMETAVTSILDAVAELSGTPVIPRDEQGDKMEDISYGTKEATKTLIFWVLVVNVFVVEVYWVAVNYNVILFFGEKSHRAKLRLYQVAMMMFVLSVSSVVVSIASGAAMEWIQRRRRRLRLPHRKGIMALVSLQMLFTAVSAVMLCYVVTFTSAIVWALLFSAMIGIQDIVMLVAFADIFGKKKIGEIMGLVTSIMTCATTIGPVLGALTAGSGQLELLFFPLAVCSVCLLFACPFIQDPAT